jgi:hypothetical protein
MRTIDPGFLEEFERDPAPHVERVDLELGRPFFEIDVLRDPYVDSVPDAAEDDRDRGALAAVESRLMERVRDLRAPFDGELPCDLLLSYGDPLSAPAEASAPAGIATELWSAALKGAGDRYARKRWMSVAAGECRGHSGGEGTPPGTHDVAAVFGMYRGREIDAYVVVVGLNPVFDDGRRGRRDCGVTRLVRALATRGGQSAPVYLLCVTPRDLLDGSTPGAAPFRRFLAGLRPSLVLHAGSAVSGLVRLSATDLRDEERRSHELSLVSCPTSKAGEGTPGMARLRLDIDNCAATVAFRLDLGSDRMPIRPIQVLQPLESVSRVSGAEQKLYGRVCCLLDDAERHEGLPAASVESFRSHVTRTWEADGYVPLCDEDGALPDIPATRHSGYRLLLLLREAPDGGYDVLLSNHTPLSRPVVARWDTLLLPAFKQPKALLERLRDDVLRQAVTQAEDLERADRARSFEEAVASMLEGDDANIWAEEVSPLASFTTRKISPTDGRVTEYTYELVTLLPLVNRDRERESDGSHASSKIVDWLDGLQAVRADGRDGIPLEAIEGGGSGLRWDPETGLATRRDGAQRQRARSLPRGVVWFPLDEAEPLWRRCPSIVARNLDVMLWLERELQSRRSDGRFGPDLLLATAS